MATTKQPKDGLAAVSIHAGGKAYKLGGPAPDGITARPLAYEALRWSYVLRARERWVDNPEARSQHEQDAQRTLRSFGLSPADIAGIARAEQVSVRMAYRDEGIGWAGRIFPWEYVIAAATRGLRVRSGHRFAVMRELLPQGTARPQPAKATGTRKLLYVQSAPGRLSDGWDFEGERKRLERSLRGRATIQVLKNPTLTALAAEVRAFKPDVLHLSGFDNVQGLRELRELAGPQTLVDVSPALLDGEGEFELAQGLVPCTLARLLQDERVLQDGYLMTSPNGRPGVVTAIDLAAALKKTGHTPFIAGISVANSAARTAALVVGEGAAASAIGFQGEIDNALADYFFELLYAEWLVQAEGLSSAFQRTWARARQQPHARRATGIALWSSFVLDTGAPVSEGAAHLQRDGKEPPTLDAVPVDEMNYAVLHNTRIGGLFKSFVIERNDAKPGTRIAADVELHLGAEKAAFSKCFVVGDEDRWNLADQIHVPLTAALVRSVRETVNSSVVVQLAVNGEVRLRESHRVRLLPVDQWRDNARDGQWLPSFVLPRDPAVMRAVQQAQRYVRVLRDDPTVGFEGYQAAPDLPPPEEQLTEVDLQVQALWATLVHDWQLGYINPPPTYSSELDSQRLRTPSTVLRNASGTCIDLALLFAACLELVDIYPVIFLLEGHALPGYWRHHSYHEAFNLAIQPPGEGGDKRDARRSSSADIQKHPWQALGRDAHRELAARIRSRELVPIETVRLTEHCGFVDAIEAGVEALDGAGEFHSMLDIVRARQHGVTPLPIVEETP